MDLNSEFSPDLVARLKETGVSDEDIQQLQQISSQIDGEIEALSPKQAKELFTNIFLEPLYAIGYNPEDFATGGECDIAKEMTSIYRKLPLDTKKIVMKQHLFNFYLNFDEGEHYGCDCDCEGDCDCDADADNG